MTEPTVSPVPGPLRLGWMLFMQPLKLQVLVEAWGFEGVRQLIDLFSRDLRRKLKAKDPTARRLTQNLIVLLFVVMPTVTLASAGALDLAGFEVDWPQVFVGVFWGVFVGVFGGVFWGVFVGVFVGVFLGVFWGVFLGVFGGVFSAVFVGVFGGVLLGVFVGVFVGVVGGVLLGVFGGVVGGFLEAATGDGVILREVFDFSKYYVPIFLLTYSRLPLYILEAPWTLLLSVLTRGFGVQPARLVRYLPFRHHDVIWFPLPGLRPFLVALGRDDPALGRQLLTEAAETIGQKRPTRLALAELQAHGLARAARDRLFAKVADLDLEFPPDADDPRIAPFREAAANLLAARNSTNQLHRERALKRARKALEGGQYQRARERRPSFEDRQIQSVLRLWLDVVDDEERRLETDRRDNRQIPIPFIVGPALGPDHESKVDALALFKGRRDLIRIIDQDLASDKREPIVLIGQRRMGKTSLLNMLPQRLGTVTRVVPLTFQTLSGSEHREVPHRLIADAVAASVPDAPSPPTDQAWGPTLDWLRTVDATLATDDQRLLVTIDEVEGLERGMREGWASPDVLDLIRAAGDQLRQIRVLLATAHPLKSLGPEWVDRLINVVLRRLGPLDAADARELITHPVPDVDHRDLYPEAAVDHILEQTARHPYLIQLTCDVLCRHLNAERRHRATDADLERAFDDVLAETPLFTELWRQRTDAEKLLLQDLADGGDGHGAPRGVRRELEREGYIVQRGEGLAVTVPLFGTWIAGET